MLITNGAAKRLHQALPTSCPTALFSLGAPDADVDGDILLDTLSSELLLVAVEVELEVEEPDE